MIRTAVLLLLASSAAHAGDNSFGIAVGYQSDLPDAASPTTRFGGPTFAIPVKLGVSPMARLRIEPRFDLGWGTDTVTWEGEGGSFRYYDDNHFSMLAGGSLLVGGEFDLTQGPGIRPHIGANIGPSWVGTYHSFGGPTQPLLDPEQNDLSSSGNVDPYTTQLAFMTDLRAGARIPAGDALALDLELGYSTAFLGAKGLVKTPPELDARREAYGWNAIRFGVAMQFLL